MKYIKRFKFRIYPNKKQIEMIGLIWECARFVYNHFLAIRKERWVKKRESLTYEEFSRMRTQLKREPKFAWLHSADSETLRESLMKSFSSYGILRCFKIDCFRLP